MHNLGRPVGQTASAGFQIGVRRTLPIAKAQAWEALTSPDGLKLWLGDLAALPLEPKQRYTTVEGTTGEMRVVKPLEQLRLTWQPKGWPKASTVQIRFLSSNPTKTTISFHQEHLADVFVREEMRQRWEAVLNALSQAVTRA